MDQKSTLKGLNEAVQINTGELEGRKQTLSISPVAHVTKSEIKELRRKMHLTQRGFAELVGVSKKTVEAWEKGTNEPNGSARRLIGLLREDPEIPEKYHLILR